MKICLVSDGWESSQGGIQTVNREIALALVHHPDVEKVCCVLPSPTSRDISRARRGQVELLHGGRSYLECLTPLKDFGPDFVIGHSYFTGEAAHALAKVTDSKWIQFVHFDPEEVETFKVGRDNIASIREEKSKRELELCLLADIVVCIGPRLFREYNSRIRASMRIGVKPVVRLDGGYKQKGIREKPLSLEVLAIGRTEGVKVKGLDLLAIASGILAAEVSSTQRNNIRIRIRGAREDAEILENKLKSIVEKKFAGVTPNIQVLKYDEHTNTLLADLRRATMLVMPSRAEGYGLVALEAFSIGVPALLSNNSGVAELLEEAKGVGFNPLRFSIDVGRRPEASARELSKKIKDVIDYYDSYERDVNQIRNYLNTAATWTKAAHDLIHALKSYSRESISKSPAETAIDLKPIGVDGAAKQFSHIPLNYLISVEQSVLENYALTQIAEEEYTAGRSAANAGDWDSSFKHHLKSLVSWRQLRKKSRIARSLGRLAWVLIAQGSIQQALKRLKEAAEIHVLQAAANYFWGAQYCFRAGNDELAERLLDQFVNLMLRFRIIDPEPNDFFRPAGALHIVARFYEALVESEENDGWSDTSWSDRGRLALIKSALDDADAEKYLEEAQINFEKCGLSSYVAFCKGKIALRKGFDQNFPQSRVDALVNASTLLGSVTQRFPRQEATLRIYLQLISLEKTLINEIDKTNWKQMLPEILFLHQTDTLSQSEERSIKGLLHRINSLSNCEQLDRSTALNLSNAFRSIYQKLPDLEGYYLPTLEKVLTNRLTKRIHPKLTRGQP